MIKSKLQWKQGMEFHGSCGGHDVVMDAKGPLGQDRGFTPKELVAIGLAGCTAMDVAALMKKYKQPVEMFEMDCEIESTSGNHPARFASVLMTYSFKGAVDSEKCKEAVHLSQTKYCGVSAMISATCPINYRVLVNGDEISTGRAFFEGISQP